jgi:hypothetical protein
MRGSAPARVRSVGVLMLVMGGVLWLGRGLLPLAAQGRVPAAGGRQAPEIDWTELVPPEVDVVVRVAGLQRVLDLIEKSVDATLPGYGAQARQQTAKVAVANWLGLQSLEGISRDGQLVIGLKLSPGTEQFIRPVWIAAEGAEYEAVRRSLRRGADAAGVKMERLAGGIERVQRGEEVFFLAVHRGVVVRSPEEQWLRELLEKGSFRYPASGAAKQLVSTAPIGVFLQWRRFDPLIQEALREVHGVLEQADVAAVEGEAPGVPLGLVQEGLATFRKQLKALGQLSSDGSQLGVGLWLSPRDYRAELSYEVVPTSITAQLLKQFPDVENPDFWLLPEGAQLYSSTVGVEPLLKLGADWASLTLAGGIRASGAEAVTEAVLRAGAQKVAYAGWFKPGALEYFLVVRARDPGLLKQSVQKFWTDASTSETLKDRFFLREVHVAPKPILYRDLELYQIHVRWDFELFQQLLPDPNAVEAARRLLAEGTTMWLTTGDDMYLEVGVTDEAAMKARLDQFLDGKRALGQMTGARAMLDGRAHTYKFVALVDVAGLLWAIFGSFLGERALPPLPGPPSFLAAAFDTQPTTVKIRVDVPVTTVQQVSQFFQGLMQSFPAPPEEGERL